MELNDGSDISDWDYKPDLDLLPEPLFAKYLLMPVKAPNKTTGGIIIPDQATEVYDYKSFVCRVIKRGPGVGKHPRYKEQMDLADTDYPVVGDYVVLSNNFNPNRMNIGGISFLLVNEDSIGAVIPKERATADTLLAYKIL